MLVINETAAATLNPVWIAIVSACAALAGAALTSAVAMRQQRLQRDHDSVENDKDRRAELRREVYLNYVSEFGKAVTMLSQLPEIDLSVARGGDLVEGFFAACAKSKLVSNPETALLIGEVEARFGELLPKMMLKAMPLYDLRSKIELAQQFYDEAQAEVSRLTAARDAHNESGKPDPLVFQVLSWNLSFQLGRSRTYSDERAHWQRVRIEKQLEYAVVSLEEVLDLYDLEAKVEVALRGDLGVGGSTEAFLHQVEQQKERKRFAMARFIAEMRAMMKKGEEDN